MLTACRRITRLPIRSIRGIATGSFNYESSVKPWPSESSKDDSKSIYSDRLLRTYIENISWQTGKALGTTGLAATAGVAGITSGVPYAGLICTGGIFVALWSAFKFPEESPTVKIDEQRGTIEESNTTERINYANGIYIGTGLSMAHILTGALATVPSAIPLAGLLTAGTMGGMIHWAKRKSPGELSKWGPALHVGLWSLVCTNLGMLAYHFMVGGISPEIIFIENIAGVGLFSAITAYDFNRIITEFTEEKKIDTLGNATHFHLNFLNIFVRYLQMFKSKDH